MGLAFVLMCVCREYWQKRKGVECFFPVASIILLTAVGQLQITDFATLFGRFSDFSLGPGLRKFIGKSIIWLSIVCSPLLIYLIYLI